MTYSDVLREMDKLHRRLWVLADSLKEGDTITLHADMTRLPGDIKRDLKGEVTEKKPAGPDGRPGYDIRFTDQNGDDWRVRFVKPGYLDDGDYHHGTAALYRSDHWSANTGVVLELDVAADGHHLIGGYVSIPMDETRCPECGNESGNVETDRVGAVQPIPPNKSGECGECGHTGHPLIFAREWKWKRMDDDEREQAKKKSERFVDQMADYQYSSDYLSQQREP